MAKKTGLLSAPVRVFWALDLGIDGGIPRERAVQVAEELIALKVFYITVRMSGNSYAATRTAAGIIRKLSTSAHTTLSLSSPEAFPGWDMAAGIKTLDIYNPVPGGLEKFTKILANAPGGAAGAAIAISVTLIPEKGKLEEILETIDEGLKLGIKNFSLANPDLVSPHFLAPSPSAGRGGEEERHSRPGFIHTGAGSGRNPAAFILDKDDREFLKQGLESLLAPPPVDRPPHGDIARLLVHDLFLHEALELPGLGRTEYAGC
ncbi:MAG: hypothetical protein ACYDFU_08290, partial [Nitrospirota bacterium]